MGCFRGFAEESRECLLRQGLGFISLGLRFVHPQYPRPRRNACKSSSAPCDALQSIFLNPCRSDVRMEAPGSNIPRTCSTERSCPCSASTSTNLLGPQKKPFNSKRAPWFLFLGYSFGLALKPRAIWSRSPITPPADSNRGAAAV